MAQEHPTAAAMASYTRSRLPFARPQTLQNPPKPSKPSKSPASSAGKRYPNKPNTRHCRAQKPPQGHSNAQGHPAAAAMASYTRSRLPFARPQTLQNPPKPSKPSKSPASSAGKRYPNKPNTRHSRTQKPPQGHSNGSRAPHGRSNGFLYAFKAAVCQASNAPKPSKPSKSPASSARKRYPNKPNTRHSRTQKPPQGHSNGSRAPHGRSNGFLYAFKAAVCQASNAPKPSKTLQTLQKSALQTLQKSGQLRKEKVPQQAQHAPLPHAKATTRPQQWLKSTPRPQQWLLIRVQGCRLPGLKRSKTLQTLQKSGQLRREKVPQQAQHAPLPHAKATTRPQQWLKGTPRPQQWLLIRVQGCRLPGFKRSKTLQTSKSPASSARKRYPNKPNTRHSRTQKPPQGHSNGSRAPHGRSNGFLYAFKAAVCQASNAPKPSKPSKSPASSARKRGTLQGKGTPTSPTRATPARKSHHKATAMAQEHPTAAAMASYTRSRLPFARPQTLQNPPNPPKVRPAPQGKGTPTSPTRATAARKSHHKATAMAQGHPAAAAMASYTRSRLPFARPQTLQNPPKPSKPSKSPASSAGKRYPNKPNTRHSRTQKPPQGHSNGSRAPHGRSNGFL